MWRRCFFILFCLLSYCLSGYAQDSTAVAVSISEIRFEGLKRTKSYILYRELPFQIGDRIAMDELIDKIAEGEQRLLNTNLFVSVEGNVKNWSGENEVSVVYQLREQFFISGYFIFDLADRNFNVWWEEQNRSLDRIDYGLRASHDNITGRADELSVGFTLGFTRKLDLSYENPGINRKRTIGLRTKILVAQNRETNYTTAGNKFIFYRADDFQLERFKVETRITLRPKLDYYQYLDLGYFQNNTSDTLATSLNPSFFLEGKTEQRYFEIGYSFIVDKRIQKPYTIKGWYARFNLIQSGIGVFGDRSSTIIRTSLAKYFQFGKKLSLELFNRNQVFLSKAPQSYFNNRALGSRKDFMIGYELYAIDGTDYGYLKASLRWELFNGLYGAPGLKLLKRMRLLPVPIKAYLTINNDVGYVSEKAYAQSNALANIPLWGAGLGLDFVFYHDKVFQVQYSFNHLLEKGIFLHYKQNF